MEELLSPALVLSDHGHNTLLRYDQRGSGLSDWNVDDFSFERSLSDFEELIESVGFDKFALVGSCQGGPIGAAYAARHPARVTKLILVARLLEDGRLPAA